jgi:primase-polymerase (primpol)-like protein
MTRDGTASGTGVTPNEFGGDPTRIPASMRNALQWVNWRYELRGGKVTKVPCRPDGRPASSTDPSTWSSLEVVLRPSVPVDGIGFVFGSLRGVSLGGRTT